MSWTRARDLRAGGQSSVRGEPMSTRNAASVAILKGRGQSGSSPSRTIGRAVVAPGAGRRVTTSKPARSNMESVPR
jgi:hypothetical protein